MFSLGSCKLFSGYDVAVVSSPWSLGIASGAGSHASRGSQKVYVRSNVLLGSLTGPGNDWFSGIDHKVWPMRSPGLA